MKYPFDIVDYFTTKATFAISANFTKREATEDNPLDSPLKIFDDSFSRFVCTIITEGKASYANIPLDIISSVRAKTDYAANKLYDTKYNNNSSSAGTSPAFTIRFRAGDLKGKTPVDVLLEKGTEEGKRVLNEQFKYLKANLSKYPKNQELIDAIIDAGKLDLNSLTDYEKSSSYEIEILDIGCRPLQRKKREDGKSFCYEISVMCDTSKNYPIQVTVKNYYAPVIVKEGGTLNVKLSEKDTSTEIKNVFSMTLEQWQHTVHEMEDIKLLFKQMHMANAFSAARKADKENRTSGSPS